MKRTALLIFTALCILACTAPIEKSGLERAAEIVGESPADALHLLDGTDTTALDAASMAEYTLLYMEAEVGSYGTVIVTKDGAAKRAGEYFLRKGDSAKLGRMWAAVAKAQYGEGKFKAAAESYATAVTMLEEQKQDVSARLESARLRFFVLALFAVLLIVIGYNYLRLEKAANAKRLEEEKAEKDQVMALAEELKGKLSKAGSNRTNEEFSVLERLCEQYYVYEGTDNLQPKILKEVRSLIEGLRNDPAKIETMLDRNEGGLMTRFREQNRQLKEDDMRLFAFAAAGFSSTAISALMEKDKQYIYNRIYRLKGRISSSDAPDKDQFLSYLTK